MDGGMRNSFVIESTWASVLGNQALESDNKVNGPICTFRRVKSSFSTCTIMRVHSHICACELAGLCVHVYLRAPAVCKRAHINWQWCTSMCVHARRLVKVCAWTVWRNRCGDDDRRRCRCPNVSSVLLSFPLSGWWMDSWSDAALVFFGISPSLLSCQHA